ncbi:uncharacterized protein LOC141621063 [Silene latifolia]|uniref:uncharacterized protein LOC141621063 n=1 Tax=Silene latifolia TaxID=37657 RepID=UPI003D781A7F
MGSLIGHVAPGFGFILIGLWHMYNHLRLLALKGPSSYKSRLWFPSNQGRLPRRLELYLIITGFTLSVTMELFINPAKHQPLDSDGTIPSDHLHNFEHSPIYLTFIIFALFALILDKWASRPLPAQDDILLILAGFCFAQELLMFHLHSIDHMGVEGQYHWLLQLVVFVSLVTTILGFGRGGAGSFVVAFVRSLSIVFQGVWFVIMGFALWTPGFIAKGCSIHVEDNGHKEIRCEGEESLNRAKALVNILFSWNLILLVVFAASFYMFMMIVFGNRSVKYSVLSLSTNEQEEEDEEEVEDDVEAHKKINNLAGTQGFVDI